MRLPIEFWLETQEFNENAKSLFKEAIICYKSSAYRAGLLFSYLGFQLVLKDRIIMADKPNYIHERAWETIKKNLRKEDAWDTEINECIKKNDENKRIFLINEDIRQQAIYWKYRRNDCAHSKPNIIDSSHVESFWLFLRSNLSKFVVNGSKDALIQKIERHFNPNFTKDGEDFSHLISEVSHAIIEEDFEEFFISITEIFMKYEMFYPIIAESAMSFWNELIKLESSIKENAINFLKRYPKVEVAFLGEHPERVPLFYPESNTSDIRHLWREKLNNAGSAKFPVLASLIRNGLIKDDYEEIFDHTVRTVGATSPRAQEIPLLLELGYYSKYKNIVFRDDFPLINAFDWANKTHLSIGNHLDVIGLDENIVEVINRTFESSAYPFKMRDSLTKYFTKSEEKKRQYIEICAELGIQPTSKLGF